MKKEWKKRFVFGFIVFMLLSMVVPVLAGSGADTASNPTIGPTATEAGEGVNDLFVGFLDFFAAAIGWQDSTNELFLITYLFMAIIIFAFVYTVIDTLNIDFRWGSRFGGFINVLLAGSITILSLIALPRGFFTLILPEYGAMGAAILTLVPFAIIFWVSVRMRSIALGKMVWGMFALYHITYYVMWAMGWGLSTDMRTLRGSSGWFYLIVGIAGLLMFLFIPYVRAMFGRATVQDIVEDVDQAGKLTRALMHTRGEELAAYEEMTRVASNSRG